jgi:hypothetical protein
MPGSSSWMPYAPQGVKGFDDDDLPKREHTVPTLNLFKEKIAVRCEHHRKCARAHTHTHTHTHIYIYVYIYIYIYVKCKIESFLMLVCAVQAVTTGVYGFGLL